MSELRAEAINLVEEIPEESLSKFLTMIKDFLKDEDPFWSESNQKHLAKVIDDMNHGRNMTQHDLIEVD